jgi:hypothetical protein
MSEVDPKHRSDDGYQSGLARLRSGREQYRTECRQVGARWARMRTGYGLLARVARLKRQELVEAGDLAAAIDEDFDNLSVAQLDHATRTAMNELFGCDKPDKDQIRGFIEGAASVFDEVSKAG